jgi:hypothetical protein
MIADKIKYIADLVMGLMSYGASSENNYKQFPLPLAIIVCTVAVIILGLLCSAGIMILLSYLKQF